jgi:hypothetical protein
MPAAEDAGFCPNCGAAIKTPAANEPIAQTEDQDDLAGPKYSRWPLILGILLMLVLAGTYYFIFVRDDLAKSGGIPVAGAARSQRAEPKITQMYASTDTVVRDQAVISGSNIINNVKRGMPLSGLIMSGTAEGEQWLALSDGAGFVSLANLNLNPAPVLTKAFGRKSVTLANPAELWDNASADAVLLDRLSKGFEITASGITQNGYLEILLKKGGVAFIADGNQVLEDAQKPPLAPPVLLQIDQSGCAAGPEIDYIFKRIRDRQAANLKAVEEAEYASDDARDAAINKFIQRTEGKSIILPLERSFRGLTITGVAQHSESQSVYFAEPPEQVRKVFRDAGYRVGRDGSLPSRDIYAGIDAAPKGNAVYGKTDLGCGV